MSILTKINQISNELASLINLPKKRASDIDTIYSLCELANNVKWDREEIALLDFFSKRIDISNKLFISYDKYGRRLSEEFITDPIILSLAISLLYKALFFDLELKSGNGITLKRFNTLFKAMDLIDVDWLSSDSELKVVLDNSWQTFLFGIQESTLNLKVTAPDLSSGSFNGDEDFRIIPLTVLFYEGPISRAYFETIYSLGLKPQKIIQLVASHDVASNKAVGQWLPKSLRIAYASIIQKNKIHYWPKHTGRDYTLLNI